MRLVFLFLALSNLTLAQLKPDIYQSPDIKECKSHKVIAILPFYCITDSSDYVKSARYKAIQEQQLGQEFQTILYTMMTSFDTHFSVRVQDIYSTNEHLRQAQITDFRNADMRQVAEVLQVDAVIWGVVVTDYQQFRNDPVLKKLLERQHIPSESKRKDAFISIFDARGECAWTLCANSELLRAFLYFQLINVKCFQWMQYMPYWTGDKIKPL